MGKVVVTLGGVELAANSPVMWKLTTGVQPYKTVFSVHKDIWKEDLEKKIGDPLQLKIDQGGGKSQTIQHVYILHKTPSASPNRVSFVVADRRWKWQYTIVARDYNITKKSGNRTVLYDKAPVENAVTVDKYNFKAYSLHGGYKWTAQEVIEDILDILNSDGGLRHTVEAWPVTGEFSVQNLSFRDQGDVALSRALGFAPGASVYIDVAGLTRVIDGTDFDGSEKHLDSLPPSTWDGDAETVIDRKAVRPSQYHVHYTREVECVFEYIDDQANTTATDPDPTEPYLENVMATVDPITEVTHYDPDVGHKVTHNVPQGTWVNFQDLMVAWDDDKPEGSMAWNFETISRHWIKGNLDAMLGGAGRQGIPDVDPSGNVAMRIQAIKQHFRQTFRINRRYMERIRDIKTTRVSPMDAVTGARSHSPVWGQYCVIPSTKGDQIAARSDEGRPGVWRNVDTIPTAGSLVDNTPGPGRASFIDRDLGVFRVDWLASPYGTVDSILPCHVVDKDGLITTPSRNTKDQDERPMGPGMVTSGHTNGIFLRETMEMAVLMTIIPGAPNSERQFHTEVVNAGDISELFRTALRITNGEGPVLNLYVSPGESTARFAWTDDNAARYRMKQILGADFDDPTTAGLAKGTRHIHGFKWLNELNEVTPHAKAFAAEAAATFADAIQGRVSTRLPSETLELKGNMSGATISIAAAPSAKVTVVHEFPGQQKPISRNALMSDDARRLTQGIVPFKGEV